MTLGARALAAGLLFTFALASEDASAAAPQVAVVDGSEPLVHALDVALAPWGVEVSEHAVVGPGATMPMATDRARALAGDTRADVVVWLSSDPASGAFALWVYDADSDHASTRKLPSGPPFDETTAAGIALSVKTILRTTAIAPPPERFGAASPTLHGAGWRLDLDLGGAWRTGTPELVEPRGSLAASVWPGAGRRVFGVVLGVEGGTGIRVDDARFGATVIDLALRAAIALRFGIGRSMGVEASLGAAAHALFIDGFVAGEQAPTSIRRFDPALEPKLSLDYAPGGGKLHVGPWIGLSYLTLSQSIAIHGAQVFDLAPLSALAGLRLSVDVL